MNIRSIAGVISPYITKVREKTTTQSDADRDPQKEGGDGQERKRKLTAEELEAVKVYVQDLPGFKENNLTLRPVSEDDTFVLFIEDPSGKIVRRIAGVELRELFSQSLKKNPSTKGRILNRAM